MLSYIVRRTLYMIPTLLLISIVSFLVIQLQPGDILSEYRLNPRINQETLNRMAQQLGVDQPIHRRYWKWLVTMVTKPYEVRSIHPESGERPVLLLFWERLPATLLVTLPTFLFAWLLSIPIGIYSALRQYSLGDHVFTFLGFLGLATPNFFLALLLMYILAVYFGAGSVGGLSSSQYISAPWSWAKFVDYLQHVWVAVVVLGTGTMAGLIRYTRGNMLDILGAPYVQTARSKGLAERIVIYKHALRNAVNPLISIFGLSLPGLFSGALITVIVLNIPSVELQLYQSLLQKDEYVVMTFLMLLAFLLQLANLLADIMLAWVDPRIRYD